MKKSIAVTTILLLACLCITAQTKWLNPKPSGYVNTKIYFINDSTGYLMNYNGDLFITKDTGATWQLLKNFPTAKTFQIHDSIGVIPLSDGSLYLSNDKGATWQKHTNTPGSLVPWADIVGRDTIFVLKYIGNIMALYRSVDRANTWQLMNNNINQFNINNLDFLTSLRGYATRADGIFKTVDGGVSWTKIYSVTGTPNVTCTKFIDTATGYAFRQEDGMLKTTNGGVTWTPSNPIVDGINDIFVVNANTAYAVGEDGAAWKTTDGGASWNWVGPNGRVDAMTLNSQYFFNDTTGIATGDRGRLVKTTNGGSSWTQYSPTYIDVTGVSFPNNNTTGYATTWNNLYKTVDTGNTWQALSLTSGAGRFTGCRFWSKDTGIITADNPARVFKTKDGGQTWATTSLLSMGLYSFDNLSGMSFINHDTGYISVYQSAYAPYGLFKTTDAGETWQPVNSNQLVRKIYFVNDKLGYGLGEIYTYRTTDGGNTWTQTLAPNYGSGLNSMWFTSASKGFMGSDQDDYMQMTVDSGKTWTSVNLPNNVLVHLLSISFYNPRIGYFTDQEGDVYQTIDSGYHWQLAAKTARGTSCIDYKKDSTVILGGMYGSIVAVGMGSYAIDSVKATTAACSSMFKAKISASLSPVDSVFFEYGKHGYTNTIKADSIPISDSTVTITAPVADLTPDSTYTMRVKIWYKGKNYYSDDIVFVPQKSPAPVITASGNVLLSSYASGNQWYFNGDTISGATSQQYTATKSGIYTVIASQNGCITPSSAGYNVSISVTAVNDVNALNETIVIAPNPATGNEIAINTADRRYLVLNIIDIKGVVLKQQALKTNNNTVSLSGLQKGVYIFSITDTKTKETINRKILKL